RHRDRDRRLDALADHLQHRHIRNQRHAEIAMQQLADPGEELGVERFVQSERGADALKLLGRRIVAGQNRGGIARRQPQQQKHEQRHHAHDGNGGKNAAEQVSEHQVHPLCRPCESTNPYAGKSRCNVGADVRNDDAGRGLWVPDFAGTTDRDCGTLQKSITMLLSHSAAPMQVLANPVPSGQERSSCYSSVASNPAIRRPRSARLSTSMCSLSVCASAPRTPSPSRVGIPIAPVKLPSEPPPALPCGSSRPIAFATPRAFSYSARVPASGSHTGRVTPRVTLNVTSLAVPDSASIRSTPRSRSAWRLAMLSASPVHVVATQLTHC